MLYKTTGNITKSAEQIRRQRKKAYSEADYKRREEMLLALEKTSQYLAVETDINLILTRMAETLLNALGAKYVNFWSLTPDKKALFITAAAGMQPTYLEHSRQDPMKIGTAWIGRAMETGQPWSSSDVPKDPNLPHSWLKVVLEQNYHGLVCFPMMAKGAAIGGMCIYYKDVHKFDYTEVLIGSIVANQAATAVANSRLFGELLAERNKTLASVRSLKDGLIMYDLDGKIILFNPRAQELLWLREEDVLNKVVDEKMSLESVYLRNLFRIENISQADFETKEFTTEGPQRVVLEITYIPVRDQYKKIGAMQILSDITKEKEVELLKSSFVSVASHQLRTPLSAIKWSLGSLIQDGNGNLTISQKEMLQKTFAVNEHLIHLVNDLLDVSRIEEGKFGYEFNLENLEQPVGGILKDLKLQAQLHKIEIVFEQPSGSLPKVMLDRKKMDIAIRNVLDNAIKYTLPGGKVNVKFQIGLNKKYLFLRVEDTGIGIPEKDQKFIFIKFFRARNAIKHETEGSGLGLYIAKKIAERHNVALFFESRENVGSAFVFQFPLENDKMIKCQKIWATKQRIKI